MAGLFDDDKVVVKSKGLFADDEEAFAPAPEPQVTAPVVDPPQEPEPQPRMSTEELLAPVDAMAEFVRGVTMLAPAGLAGIGDLMMGGDANSAAEMVRKVGSFAQTENPNVNAVLQNNLMAKASENIVEPLATGVADVARGHLETPGLFPPVSDEVVDATAATAFAATELGTWVLGARVLKGAPGTIKASMKAKPVRDFKSRNASPEMLKDFETMRDLNPDMSLGEFLRKFPQFKKQAFAERSAPENPLTNEAPKKTGEAPKAPEPTVENTVKTNVDTKDSQGLSIRERKQLDEIGEKYFGLENAPDEAFDGIDPAVVETYVQEAIDARPEEVKPVVTKPSGNKKRTGWRLNKKAKDVSQDQRDAIEGVVSNLATFEQAQGMFTDTDIGAHWYGLQAAKERFGIKSEKGTKKKEESKVSPEVVEDEKAVEDVKLYRGDPVILESPKAKSHPGVYFFTEENQHLAKGHAKSMRDPSLKGEVRELKVPGDTISKLANLNDDEVYKSILGEEDSFNSSIESRGVMPSNEMAQNLRDRGYTGFKVTKPDNSEIFLLPEFSESLKYEPIETAESAAADEVVQEELVEEEKAELEDQPLSDPEGNVLEFYRGKKIDSRGSNLLWGSPDKGVAENFAEGETAADPVGPIQKFTVNTSNIFDFKNPEHLKTLIKAGIPKEAMTLISQGDWAALEAKDIQDIIKAEGFKGFRTIENHPTNSGEMVKSNNVALYDEASAVIEEVPEPQVEPNLTPTQIKAAEKTAAKELVNEEKSESKKQTFIRSKIDSIEGLRLSKDTRTSVTNSLDKVGEILALIEDKKIRQARKLLDAEDPLGYFDIALSEENYRGNEAIELLTELEGFMHKAVGETVKVATGEKPAVHVPVLKKYQEFKDLDELDLDYELKPKENSYKPMVYRSIESASRAVEESEKFPDILRVGNKYYLGHSHLDVELRGTANLAAIELALESEKAEVDEVPSEAKADPRSAKDSDGKVAVLYRATSSEGLEPREGYATFASNVPEVSGSYIQSNPNLGQGGAIFPFTAKVDNVIEFPVTKATRGKGNDFDRFDFDLQAKKLQPGEALVARNVDDPGPFASSDIDKNLVYSYPSDIWAFPKGAELKSIYDKPRDSKVETIKSSKPFSKVVDGVFMSTTADGRSIAIVKEGPKNFEGYLGTPEQVQANTAELIGSWSSLPKAKKALEGGQNSLVKKEINYSEMMDYLDNKVKEHKELKGSEQAELDELIAEQDMDMAEEDNFETVSLESLELTDEFDDGYFQGRDISDTAEDLVTLFQDDRGSFGPETRKEIIQARRRLVADVKNLTRLGKQAGVEYLVEPFNEKFEPFLRGVSDFIKDEKGEAKWDKDNAFSTLVKDFIDSFAHLFKLIKLKLRKAWRWLMDSKVENNKSLSKAEQARSNHYVMEEYSNMVDAMMTSKDAATQQMVEFLTDQGRLVPDHRVGDTNIPIAAKPLISKVKPIQLDVGKDFDPGPLKNLRSPSHMMREHFNVQNTPVIDVFESIMAFSTNNKNFHNWKRGLLRDVPKDDVQMLEKLEPLYEKFKPLIEANRKQEKKIAELNARKRGTKTEEGLKEIDKKLKVANAKNKRQKNTLKTQFFPEKAKMFREIAKDSSSARIMLQVAEELPEGIELSPEEIQIAEQVTKYFEYISARMEDQGLAVIKDRLPYMHKILPEALKGIGQEAYSESINVPALLSFMHQSKDSQVWFPSMHLTLNKYIPLVERKLAYQPFLNRWSEFIATAPPELSKYLTQWIKSNFDQKMPTTGEQVMNFVVTAQYVRLVGFSTSVAFKHLTKVFDTISMFNAVSNVKGLSASAQTMWKMAAQNLGLNVKDTNDMRLVRAYVTARELIRLMDESPGFKILGARFKQVTGSLVMGIEYFDNGASIIAAAVEGKAKDIPPEQIHRLIWDTILMANFRGKADMPEIFKSSGGRAVGMFQSTPSKLTEFRYDMVEKLVKGGKDEFGNLNRMRLIRFFMFVGMAEAALRTRGNSLLEIMLHTPWLSHFLIPQEDFPFVAVHTPRTAASPVVQMVTDAAREDIWSAFNKQFDYLGQGSKMVKMGETKYPTKYYNSAFDHMLGLKRVDAPVWGVRKPKKSGRASRSRSRR